MEPPRIGFYICFALPWLFLLVSAVPTIALFVRRLHDSNLSGFFAFLVFVPLVNGLIVLILAVRLSVPEGARFDR
ncbi:DUF805 domain-containing protein [Agreia pratensis]|uniref:DUF805 domain-containing protein n=1 Tax=Agreia pratensis TaxID=150121 RepID=UPI001C38A2BD|nr:DUF805 domain-containing protein [Agreia pratensis]